MARIGAFDKAILLRTAFDETVHPLGRFDEDLIQRAAAPLTINVHDDDAVGEFVAIQKTGELITAVGDTDNPTEEVTVRIPMAVVVDDTEDSADVVAVTVNPLVVSVSDDDTPTDVVDVRLSLRVSVSDDDTPVDPADLVLNPLLVVVSDADLPTDVCQVIIPTAPLVVVSDDVLPADACLVSIASGPPVLVAVTDIISISERRLVLAVGYEEMSLLNARVLTCRLDDERLVMASIQGERVEQ